MASACDPDVCWADRTWSMTPRADRVVDYTKDKVAKARGEDGSALARLVDEGTLRPVIDRRFTLEEAVDALAHQATGHARGKSIVEVS